MAEDCKMNIILHQNIIEGDCVKQLIEEDLLNSLNIAKGEDITFLLGAGCSIISGCMASSKLIYEFKKRIYCAKNGIRLDSTSFIDELRLKENIEKEFMDDCITNPYSYYFEKCFPNVYDRNQFIKDNFQAKKPSFGYLCFADYLISKGVKNVLTTNFDLLIERSIRKLDENYDLVNISDNESPLLIGALNIIKLHGDYNYDKIRNTESELKAISPDLTCKLLNLELKKIVILGYSGQDNSVMNFLEEYINKFPNTTIYWCGLDEKCNEEKVLKLLSTKNSYYVSINGFDSLFEKYYQINGSNNENLNELYKKNCENISFEFSTNNQPEFFKLNAFPQTGNATVYKTQDIIDENSIQTLYFYTKYKENTYIIADKNTIDKIPNAMITICSLKDENISINLKCKLIKELVKWHTENRGLFIYRDNLYKDNNEQIKEGLKLNVDLFNGNICLILNPNYFIISDEITEIQKSSINWKKSNLYTKSNWQFLNNQIGLLFDNNFKFGDENINVSFLKSNIENPDIGGIYNCCKEPIMLGENMQSVNQIKILDTTGPKKTIFSVDEIKIGVFCCEEDKSMLSIFLNEVVNGTKGCGTDLIPTYRGFFNIFKKKIKFDFNVLPRFKLSQLNYRMQNKNIYGIIDFYEKGLKRMYDNQVDLSLIYISNNLSFIRNNTEVDFHSIIKLRAANKFKTQFLEEKTITSQDNRSKILYNFAIGIYTKTVGMPWYPINYSKETLFLGLSFGRDSNGICVGCSQMFDAAGRGMQLIISQISDKKRKNQYLSEDEAFELGRKIRLTYYKSSKIEDLNYIVIHRNDPFKDEEIAGFKKAFEGIEDFVLLQIVEDTALNAYPFSKYGCGGFPIKRGTILKASKDVAYIWTDGSVAEGDVNNGKNYRNSKRGMGRPLKVKKFHGNISLNQVANDLMYLTKMDFNSSDVLYSKLPVTIKYSRIVCDLIKEGNFDDELISFEYIM